MDYTFEVLVLDKSGQSSITKVSSLIDGLGFSEYLWKNRTADFSKSKIIDHELGIELVVYSIDTQSVLTDLLESAFIIMVQSSNFESIEEFRFSLLVHLRKRLLFGNVRILRDDISTEISNRIYPLINKVENILRRYLILFFTQKIGLEWWSSTASNSMLDKAKMRKNNEKVFSQLCDTDVTLIDFDDLGELIYKHTTGFNRQEQIVNQIMAAENMEDLARIQSELQSNYTKYFKEAFQDKQFDKKWKTLFEIRNKVAHNNLFVKSDLDQADSLSSDLIKIIDDAESKIDTFRFSLQEQEAILQATIDAVKIAEADNQSIGTGVKRSEVPIDLEDDIKSSFQIISENDLMAELLLAEKTAPIRGKTFVGLKVFVTKLLGRKGYAYGPTYSLINILKEKSMIEIYDITEPDGLFYSKAIRSVKK